MPGPRQIIQYPLRLPLLLFFSFLPTTLSYDDGNFLHELNLGQTSQHFIKKLTEIKESLFLLFKGRKPEVKNQAVCETIGV
jgi:hypothetical protein